MIKAQAKVLASMWDVATEIIARKVTDLEVGSFLT